MNARKLADRLMTVVGAIASVSSLPQVIAIWETHNVAGISFLTPPVLIP